MILSRRQLLAAGCAFAGARVLDNCGLGDDGTSTKPERTYHLSVSVEALDADSDLLSTVQAAGVTNLWLGSFLYGHWPYTLERIQTWRKRIEALGMVADAINVPLGHPGDALGSKVGNVPTTPPTHWKLGVRPDGSTYAGTSLHPPATQENVEAIRGLAALGVKRIFLDDDFRLAQGPGMIGGCFCPEHQQAFFHRTGYGEAQWKELLDAVAHRNLTPVLRDWVEFNCDQLTGCFRTQQESAPGVQLGNMVMYLGAEKAGIRLADYARVPFRVGEMMFHDAGFAPAKGKTDELFSSLFHRRFAAPDLAFSETTAFPANGLSAPNMAAKLAVSTLSDVRNTMFMSGLAAFPRSHWQTLGPAMKRNAELHRQIAGHVPRGPLKHYWGEPSRFVGDDNPFSLFLASGIPFEVTDVPASDGWTFLSDADGRAALAGTLSSPGTMFVVRSQAVGTRPGIRAVPESLPDLWAFKREIVSQLANVPFVEEDRPAVCAWYPTLRAVLLWNLSEERTDLTIKCGETRRPVTIEGLGIVLVPDICDTASG